MPPKGYVSISIRQDLYNRLEQLMVFYNARAGKRIYKSMQQLLEHLIELAERELGLKRTRP